MTLKVVLLRFSAILLFSTATSSILLAMPDFMHKLLTWKRFLWYLIDRHVLIVFFLLKLSNALDHYLTDYNNNTTRPMKLVLFLDAVAHVCRIARIIRQPMGNALLLGMGGSGKWSVGSYQEVWPSTLNLYSNNRETEFDTIGHSYSRVLVFSNRAEQGL